MYVPRPSILQRPIRDGSRANEELQDFEFAREQARMTFKTQRLAQAEERMVGAFYATPEEKRHAWGVMQREAEQLAVARAAAHEEARQREADWVSQPQRVVIDTSRPWAAVSSTYYMSPEVEKEARRRGQREASDVNRASAQRRAAQQAQEHVAEQCALHASMVSEDNYFNLGAASERWIPPEHRVKHRTAMPAQYVHAPPPYCFDDAPPSSRLTSSCGSPDMRPASASRRAQAGQGVAAAMRHDVERDVAPRGNSYSYSSGWGEGGVPGGRAAPPRPQTAPVQQQQQQRGQFPWSYAA